MAAQFNGPAIVLRSIAYREADRIVTLLGKTTGKVSAIARGARKSQRRFAGMGVGARGEARLLDRGGDLMVLEEFQATRGDVQVTADLARTAHVAYVLELCDRLCAPRQREERVFEWLDEALDRLGRGPARAERLRVFELGLLERVGLSPVLRHCALCGRGALGDQAVRWAPEAGGIVCRDCGGRGTPLDGQVRLVLLALQNNSLSEADQQTLSPEINARCRDALMQFIVLHTGGPLKTVQFIAKMGGS